MSDEQEQPPRHRKSRWSGGFRRDGTPKREPTGNHEVGYCRTPIHTRFPPGKSGNPQGSKKAKAKDVREQVRSVAGKPVRKVNKKTGKVLEVTLLEANLETLGGKGLEGDKAAARDFLRAVIPVLLEEKIEHERPQLSKNDLDILHRFLGDGGSEAQDEAEEGPELEARDADQNQHEGLGLGAECDDDGN